MKLCRVFLIGSVTVFVAALVLFALRHPGLSVLVALGLAALIASRRYYALSACGTARWGTAREARNTGMCGDTGLPLGRIAGTRPNLLTAPLALFNPRLNSRAACSAFLSAFSRKPAEGQVIRLAQAVHTAIFAPTGVGKGVSLVIPHLLTCPDPCVVIDFKGELAFKTAKHRNEFFGHRTVLIDPFKIITQQPDTYNPLEAIDKDSPTAIDECSAVANALVIRTGQEKEPHWNEIAETEITGLVASVVSYGTEGGRSLTKVADLISSPKALDKVTELMCVSHEMGGMMARLGGQMSHYQGSEKASMLTTASRHLKFLLTLAVAESTKTSSFDPAGLLTGKHTIYLILPVEHISTQKGLLRLWVSSLLRTVIKGGLKNNKVHFILDEAARLGKMDCLSDALAIGRAYGVRLQFYYQSLGQLKECWPDGQDQTLISNTSQVFFGVNDPETAKLVSDRLGEETIVIDSGGTSDGHSYQSPVQGNASSSQSRNRNANWSQQARKLLKPEEVQALPLRTAITFTPGMRPLMTTLLRYYESGKTSRWWETVKTLATSIVVFALALFMAASITALANTKFVPRSAPNGSVQKGVLRR